MVQGLIWKKTNYYTHYSDLFPTGGTFRGTWKVKNTNTLEFIPTNPNNASEVFEVNILKLEEDFLWIHDYNVEYKLKKIE